MTHTTKHTPGPWVAHHSGIGDATVVAECGWVNKDGTPFNPTIVSRIDWPTAHLIAAAPAMYLELKESLVLLRASYHDMCEKHGADSLHAQVLFERIESVCAALAQAEGR